MSVITNNNSKCMMALVALHHVYDPEIGLNVVDLGLIYQLDFDEEQKKIFCTMTLTTQYCPMGENITDNVKTSLKETFKNYEVELNLTFNPAWNYEMISNEGKEFLNR
jgi:metal-sulfur cluster biosynthetic enzyme